MELRDYINKISGVYNDMASYVRFGTNGIANFWWEDEDNLDCYKLVISHGYTTDNEIINDDIFYGDEELLLENCNEHELNADKLWDILSALPDVDLDNFYGMRAILCK